MKSENNVCLWTIYIHLFVRYAQAFSSCVAEIERVAYRDTENKVDEELLTYFLIPAVEHRKH